MKETAPDRFPRLAPILLAAALVGLAIIRPGNLAGDEALGYRLFTTLAAVALVCYIAWRFHGILAAAAVLVLFRLSEPDNPVAAAFLERAGDTLFLATLAIGIAAGSRQGRVGNRQWLVVAVAAGIATFGWYRFDQPPVGDPVAHERLRHVGLLIAVLSAVVGLLAKSATWADRVRLIVTTIGPPAIGIGFVRLVHGYWPRVLEGGDWPAVQSEWHNAIGNGEWAAGAWAWTAPWLIGVLLLVGVWRTLARGRKEWKAGRPPLAWLLTIASVGAFAAVGARPLASGSLALAAIGAMLSVFGIADLIQALVERIELKPPESGPSGGPRIP